MHVPSLSVRFGLILEAYCRGNIEHLSPLTKQVDAITYLGKLADIVKVSDDIFTNLVIINQIKRVLNFFFDRGDLYYRGYKKSN